MYQKNVTCLNYVTVMLDKIDARNVTKFNPENEFYSIHDILIIFFIFSFGFAYMMYVTRFGW